MQGLLLSTLLLSLMMTSMTYAESAAGNAKRSDLSKEERVKNIWTLDPLLAAGLRFGKEGLNDEKAGFLSFKMVFMALEAANFRSINLLVPGLNWQSDGKLSLSLSPLSVSNLSGITFGIDFFIRERNVRGGSWGIFVGLKF